MKPSFSKWEEVGSIGVDAGIIWLGDPCYTFFKPPTDVIGKNWGEFCEKLEAIEEQKEENNDVYPFGFTGIAVSSGYGDGEYPVFIKRKDGRIKEVKVVFFE